LRKSPRLSHLSSTTIGPDENEFHPALSSNGYGMKTECFHPVVNDSERIADVYEAIG